MKVIRSSVIIGSPPKYSFAEPSSSYCFKIALILAIASCADDSAVALAD